MNPQSNGATAIKRLDLLSFQSKNHNSELGKRLRSTLSTLSTRLGMPQVIFGPKKLSSSNAAFQQAAPPLLAPVSHPILADEFQTVSADGVIAQVLTETPAKGEVVVPADKAAVAALLQHTDTLTDLEALDLLQAAFPRTTRKSTNRILLAIARAVTKKFGIEGRLPFTAVCAWGMLDNELFTDEFAAQFAVISQFILGWQSENKDFLLLDPSEVDLIELMFESLHPRKQGILAAKIMDFKVLSNRRFGLLRRVPNRVEKAFRAVQAGGDTQAALQYAKDCLALLDHIARPEGFAPIIEEAKLAAAKVVKTIQSAAPPAPPPQPALPAPETSSAPQIAASPMPQSVTSAPPKRLTKRHRTEAALRFLRGENPDFIATSLGVKSAAVEGWAEAFISGGASALASREKNDSPATATAHADQVEINDLRSRVEQLSKLVETLAQDKKRTV